LPCLNRSARSQKMPGEVGLFVPGAGLGVLVRDHVEVRVGVARADAGELEVGPYVAADRNAGRLSDARDAHSRGCSMEDAPDVVVPGGAQGCAARAAGDEAI